MNSWGAREGRHEQRRGTRVSWPVPPRHTRRSTAGGRVALRSSPACPRCQNTPRQAAGRMHAEAPCRSGCREGNHTPHTREHHASFPAEGGAAARPVSQGGLVDARRTVVTAHRDPRPPHDVSAPDLVMQRMEPASRIGLGRPLKRMLQSSNRIIRLPRRDYHRSRPGPHRGGTSQIGTHRAPPSRHYARNEAAALPSPAVLLSARLDQYYDRLRLPPGTSTTSRLHTGYRHQPSTPRAGCFDRGGSPQFPPSPSQRSAPSTPRSPSRLLSRVFTASMAFTVNDPARLSLNV